MEPFRSISNELFSSSNGQLSSRVTLRYLLPELSQTETRGILQHALGSDATEEEVGLIHSVTGGIFRSVDMMIPSDHGAEATQ